MLNEKEKVAICRTTVTTKAYMYIERSLVMPTMTVDITNTGIEMIKAFLPDLLTLLSRRSSLSHYLKEKKLKKPKNPKNPRLDVKIPKRPKKPRKPKYLIQDIFNKFSLCYNLLTLC
jgi:hypothetical protein